MPWRFLRARLGNPREWCTADRVLLVTTCAFPIILWYAALGYYALAHPEIGYVDSSFVSVVLAFHVRVFIPAWLLLSAVALYMRSRRPDGQAIVYVLSVLWFGWFGLCSYFLGSHTSMYTGFIVLGGTAFGLMLFERPPVVFGTLLFLTIVTATTGAEQIGWLPYAPILTEAPFKNHRIDPSWLFTIGAADLVSVLAMLTLTDYAVARWKRDERQLAHTSEHLARANEFISRYVATQLAEQVRAGNYGPLDRHDRRRLTLFFSDIEDFAATADLMEPEDLSALLNEYLSEMTSIAERHGATIDKFVGDAIMIFFGAPSATSDADHALRAVRMALEMQARLTNLREKWLAQGIERPFRVRMGINTGQASIGNFGSQTRLEYTAIGRQVNLAARLQAQCEPGRILLSHATWVFVRDEIPCLPKGEISLKGFRDPVKAYEVRDAGEMPQGARLSPRS
jgi:class 3 adenylate cyclase